MSRTANEKIESGDFLVVAAPNGVTLVGEASAARTRFLCQIATSDGVVEISTDPGRLYAVFGDRREGIISSSLRAVLAESCRRYQIDREALCEQLVTGGVTGRETLFVGVERLDGSGTFSVNGVRGTFRISRSVTDDQPPSFRSAGACIDYQLEVLRAYFCEIADFAGNRDVSMGLSGGFDSRLLLLLALESGIRIQPFTFTSPSHVKDSLVAGELTRRAGVNLRQIGLRPMDGLDVTSLEANIDDAITYYDGRTNDTMGTFGDAHTARTQRECIGGAILNLNGLGGELYRNYQRLPGYGFPFRDWLWQFVIGPNQRDVFQSERGRLAFENRLARKYGELLGLGKLGRLDRDLARRWYREIWLPCFAGPRLSAENRVGPSLMPFASGRVSAASLGATPFIGPRGDFQAAMIRRLDEKLAAVPSIYGPGFSRSPLSRRLWDSATAFVPLRARLARHQVLGRPTRAMPNDNGILRGRFQEPLRLLRAMALPLDIDVLMQDRVARDRTLYVAEFLHRHREHIEGYG